MPRKLIIADPEKFAVAYPHLVKMVPAIVKPDNRKIFAAIDLGFALDGVQVAEAQPGEGDDESGEGQDAAAGDAVSKPDPAALLDAPEGKEPLSAEAQAIAASIIGAVALPKPDDITKGFQRFPGESERTFHTRCREMRAALETDAAAKQAAKKA